jgi:hypothetical protein
MQENFDKIMEFIFRWEDWKSDDPDDAGGRTVWGICERDYPEEFPALWDMSKEDAKIRAKVIFREKYWDKVNGDNLPPQADAIIMDIAVNNGVNFANSIKQYDSNTILMKRIERYVAIAAYGKNLKFLRGWLRRTIDLYYFVKNNFE